MESVLLVEDNENLCTLYRSELESEGFQVLVEHDGKSGLKRALDEHPDLVIMDISLPEKMDGLESMSRILGRDSSIHVILHTAYEQYRDNFLSWAADEYIVKSGNIQPLKDAIDRVLSLDESAGEKQESEKRGEDRQRGRMA